MTGTQRINVITGARSGMGKATLELLRSRGERVLGIDLRDSDVNADLSTAAGRGAAIDAVTQAFPQGIDTLILCAGLSGGRSRAKRSCQVNYFGAVELPAGLRFAAGSRQRAARRRDFFVSVDPRNMTRRSWMRALQEMSPPLEGWRQPRATRTQCIVQARSMRLRNRP